MSEGRGQGGQLPPPQILADPKVPPGSGGAPHYYLPLQIFRLCDVPDFVNFKLFFTKLSGIDPYEKRIN